MTSITTYNQLLAEKDNNIVLKLIYFWSFIEVSLGGLLHLLHIPLSGLIVGGFAVIVNVLLAKFGNNKASTFIKALSIVLAVKYLLSPYTPIGAYVAVSFQGLLAMLIFSIFGLNRITILLFAVLAMIESGLQKPLMAFLIFGKVFGDSLVALMYDTFNVSKETLNNVLILFLIGYMASYILWGIILSHWANNMRTNILDFKPDQDFYRKVKDQIDVQQKFNNATTKKKISWIQLVMFIGIIILIPALAQKLTLFYLIRTMGVFVILLLILPLLIKKHQLFLLGKNTKIVNNITIELPTIKNRMHIAWNLVENYKGLPKIKHFVFYAIWLNVFYE